jgi:Uncharacterized conserved protein
MKSKLLMGASVPVIMCVGLATAIAQTTSPPPSADNPPAATMPAPSPKVESNKLDTTKLDKNKLGKTFAGQQAADEWRSSKMIGLNVYNSKDEKIGDINDLILSPDGKTQQAIIGVGGFLGMNEKNVAVPFSELKFTRKDDGSVHVMYESTKEALQSAPNYEFYTSSRG